VVRAAVIGRVYEACKSAGIDLSESSETELSGDVTVHESGEDGDRQPSG